MAIVFVPGFCVGLEAQAWVAGFHYEPSMNEAEQRHHEADKVKRVAPRLKLALNFAGYLPMKQKDQRNRRSFMIFFSPIGVSP